jgi:uncharacterized membrane protein
VPNWAYVAPSGLLRTAADFLSLQQVYLGIFSFTLESQMRKLFNSSRSLWKILYRTNLRDMLGKTLGFLLIASMTNFNGRTYQELLDCNLNWQRRDT